MIAIIDCLSCNGAIHSCQHFHNYKLCLEGGGIIANIGILYFLPVFKACLITPLEAEILNFVIKRYVFMKNNWIWIYIKYDLERGLNFIYALVGGWIFLPPPPPPALNGQSLIKSKEQRFKTKVTRTRVPHKVDFVESCMIDSVEFVISHIWEPCK